MYKVGMYGGSFNPIHLGHVNNIIEAAAMCEKLYVVLSYSDSPNEINPKERFMWLKNITRDMENVEVVEVKDDSISKDKYDWQKGADDIKKIINENIDIVFCGTDYKDNKIFHELWKDSKIYYFDRDIIKVSSTDIRNNPYKYYEYIPNVVRPYYTKKVIVVGTESCGKSTLVRNLAKAYNTVYVEEVGREVCEKAGGIDNMQPKHYAEIIYKQIVLEDKKLKEANKVMFIDTNSLITLYYYQLAFQNKKEYNHNFELLAEATASLSDYDLYIFLEPDVKWVQDGTRTYGEDETRRKNNEMLKKLFDRMNIKYECVTGDYQERFNRSKVLVNKLLMQ